MAAASFFILLKQEPSEHLVADGRLVNEKSAIVLPSFTGTLQT
jgi:hypothetical protein